jgi:hypothetical protein
MGEELGDDAGEGEDPDRWLWVQSEGVRRGYKDMAWFIEHLEDAGMAERLAVAISRARSVSSVQGHVVAVARPDDSMA